MTTLADATTAPVRLVLQDRIVTFAGEFVTSFGSSADRYGCERFRVYTTPKANVVVHDQDDATIEVTPVANFVQSIRGSVYFYVADEVREHILAAQPIDALDI